MSVQIMVPRSANRCRKRPSSNGSRISARPSKWMNRLSSWKRIRSPSKSRACGRRADGNRRHGWRRGRRRRHLRKPRRRRDGIGGTGRSRRIPRGSSASTAEPAPHPNKSELAPTASDAKLSPAVRKLVDDNNLDASAIPATGKKGQLTKPMSKASSPKIVRHQRRRAGTAPYARPPITGMVPADELPPRPEDPREEVVKMSRLRQRIAQRLGKRRTPLRS